MSTGQHASWLRAALGLAEGEGPFPWQAGLLKRLVGGEMPRALDIPTGLGKTAVMAIWLVARACGAPVPRRMVYVVDRRAVVDQATTVAEHLQAWVSSSASVRAALGIEGALPVSTLRGQHVDNKAWLEDPSMPAIVLGTVDMVGSRLLFGGYGVSRKMRPYHAGLLGADSLIVLDEAHLVPPFERLIERIASALDANGRRFGPADTTPQALVPPLRLMSLSATGRQRGGDGGVIGLTDADHEHEIVRRRLQASKRLMLLDEVPAKELPEHLAKHAWDLAGKGTRPARIIVFCNSREHSRKVQEALIKLAGRQTIDIELFVGARRVHEREQVAQRLQERGFVAGSAHRLDHPSFVIATAAGEVGVDLDAEHAVCDLVAWERMVQRLGRVNRRGDGDASVIVVPSGTDDAKEAARRAAVCELLVALPRMSDGAGDASPGALTALRARSDLKLLIERASTPAPLHPPLTRALVESWAMTSLEEHTGRPEVEPWIRGWPDDEEPAQTTVVWRTHLPISDDGRLFGRQDLEAFRDAADPHLAERLEADTRRVLEWLGKRLQTLQPLLPHETGLERGDRPLRAGDVVGVIFDPLQGSDRVLRADGLVGHGKRDLERTLPGAMLLVDRRLGGLSSGLLDDESIDATDVTEVESEGIERIVPFRLRRVTDGDEPAAVEGWRTEASIAVRRSDDGASAWLLVESLASQAAGSEDGRSGARRAQLLEEHEAWAEDAARRLANALSLAPEYAEVLAVSARVHDEGKKAERWQRAFNAPGDGMPAYAKTTRRPNIALLDGYRHELGSLPYAEAHERVKALRPDLRELCLHLIAAHHGSARPLIRTSGAAEPPSRLAERAREIALRFSALDRTWGPWGLAWWEALLRAADQQASRRNDRAGDSNG